MNIERFVKGLGEDELHTLAKLRTPMDWRNHVKNLGPLNWIRVHFEEEIEQLMLKLQKQAQEELRAHRHVINIDIILTAATPVE